MNYKRAQLEICKEILNGEFVRGQMTVEDLILIIPGCGYYGYFFNPAEISFSMSKVHLIDLETRIIADLSIIKDENEIKITRFIRILDYKSKMARKFETKGKKDVWVDCIFLKNIDTFAAKFYQEKDIIIAVEDGVPVMCLLPIKINETEIS